MSDETKCDTNYSDLEEQNCKWYSENNHFKDMNRIDGMPTEFEWKIFPGIMTLGLLEKIQSLMRDLQCELEHFTDTIIFMSMYNDIEWGAKARGHWSFLEPGSEKKWYGTYTDKPDGSWDQTAENMMSNFSDSRHPSSAFERGELRSKGGGKKSLHFKVVRKTSCCFSAL